MENASVDYHLMYWWKNFLDNKLTPTQKVLFKSQFACQNKQVNPLGVEPAVFLLRSDKKHTALTGLNHCNNTWLCPVCSSRKMSKYKARIASAIEAMKAKGYRGFMITFTIPHNNWYSVTDCFDILKNSMKKFQKHAGCQVDPKKFANNAWTRFHRDLNLCHYIRMAEVTFGENGAHPHYHALYFTNKNLQETKKYEADCLKLWNKIVMSETKKQFYKTKGEKYSKEEIDSGVERIFKTMSEDSSFYISKNDKGEVFAMESSAYISGWGSDSEMTQQEKKSAAFGHYSQWQLMEFLAGHKKFNLDREQAEKWLLEFAIYTKKYNFYRCKFSLSKDSDGNNLNSIIKVYQQTNAYTEFIKKNYEAEKWHVVVWFNSTQWFKISELNREIPVLSNILYLSYNTKLLQEYLESLEIFAFDNPEHQYKKAYEDLFNKAA